MSSIAVVNALSPSIAADIEDAVDEFPLAAFDVLKTCNIELGFIIFGTLAWML